MTLPVRTLGTPQRDDAPALLALEDLTVACESPARLLITASTPLRVETVARCIHDGSARAQFAFVQTWARELPVDAEALREHCRHVVEGASGGSVLINAIEETPAIVQDALIDLLADLEDARQPSAGMRLMSGTTVSLLDRITAGTFSERLFYRLNIIHLMADEAPGSELPDAP